MLSDVLSEYPYDQPCAFNVPFKQIKFAALTPLFVLNEMRAEILICLLQ